VCITQGAMGGAQATGGRLSYPVPALMRLSQCEEGFMPLASDPHTGLDVQRVRRDFPILARTVHGRPLVYLDSGASSQRPRAVIEAVNHYEQTSHANIHRGVYVLSEEATVAYEQAHARVGQFMNADWDEVVFTRNTTEALNLVAYAWGLHTLQAGDEVVVT